MRTMLISIVLPSYNSQDHLPKTLASLSTQALDGDYEVIVVDSSDNGQQVATICHAYPHVRYHRVAERFNPGTGRNIGAKMARGCLLIFLDTDVSLEPGALMAAWNYYQQGHKIFGGALELDIETGPDCAAYLEHYFFNHESQKGRPICSRSNLSSALMLFDRELFLQHDGFSDLPRMQDTELTERLIREGYELTFCPSIVGRQIQDAPLDKVFRKILINGKNLYFIRYESMPVWKKGVFFVTLPALTGFKIARIVGRHLRYQDMRGKLITVGLVPLLAWSGGYWMVGLYRSMILGGGISSKRD